MTTLPPPKRRAHKFRAQRTTVEGETFHSKAEAKRHGELKLLERAGEISHLKRQVKFPLKVNGELIATWIVDWAYFEPGKGMTVEDKKSPPVRKRLDSVMKVKLFKALYPGWLVVLS